MSIVRFHATLCTRASARATGGGYVHVALATSHEPVATVDAVPMPRVVARIVCDASPRTEILVRRGRSLSTLAMTPSHPATATIWTTGTKMNMGRWASEPLDSVRLAEVREVRKGRGPAVHGLRDVGVPQRLPHRIVSPLWA